MEFKFLLVLVLSYMLTSKASQDNEIAASVKRALILDILYNLNILHDVPVRKSQFVGRKLNEARTDLAIQRAILDQSKPVHNDAPRFEKLVAPSPSHNRANRPPENLLDEFNLPKQRIKAPSFLQPKRNAPLGVGNPNLFVTRPNSVWAYMNLDNPKSTPEIRTTTAPPAIRTIKVSINSPFIVRQPNVDPDATDTHQPNKGNSDPTAVAPEEIKTKPTTRFTPTTATTSSPESMDPLGNLFYNLLQNHNQTFSLDSDITPLGPMTVDTSSAPLANDNTTDNTLSAPLNDPFAHLMSNLLKIPEAFTNSISDSPNSPSPGIASSVVEPVVNSTDPMANLFAHLLDQSPTSFGVTNVEPFSATTPSTLLLNITPSMVSPTTDTAFGNLRAGTVPIASSTTSSPLLESIFSTAASQGPTQTTRVYLDTILNAFNPPLPLITGTTTPPAASIYNNHQAGQTNSNQISADSNIAFQNLPPTPTNFQNRPLTQTNFQNIPLTQTNFQNRPLTQTNFQNIPLTQINFQNLPTEQTNSTNQSPNSQQSGSTMVHSTNSDAGQMHPNGALANPQTVIRAVPAVEPNVGATAPQTNVTNALIQMFTASLPEQPSEDNELSDLDKLLAPPTIFTLGSNDAISTPVANTIGSGSQIPNPPPTTLSKPGNTSATNEPKQIITTVTSTTDGPTSIVNKIPGINVFPLISSTIRQNAGNNQPSVIQNKQTTPSTINRGRRPNPFFNARPVPVNTQVRYPPTQTPSKPPQTRPTYIFDPVTRRYRLSNQPLNPTKPDPTTYPRAPITNQNAQEPPRHHQGSINNRYPPIPRGQNPTQNRYPYVNNQQQVPTGYRPPGFYYPNYPYTTRTVYQNHNTQTTEAPEPVEPPEAIEPPEPAEPQEPAEQEEPVIPYWNYGADSSSSSSEGD